MCLAESGSSHELIRGVAQLAERWSPKPEVASSIPAAPAIKLLWTRLVTVVGNWSCAWFWCVKWRFMLSCRQWGQRVLELVADETRFK